MLVNKRLIYLLTYLQDINQSVQQSHISYNVTCLT